MKKITLSDYTLFAEAWLMLAFSRFLLLFFPFKKLIPWLGVKQVQSATSHGGANLEVTRSVGLGIARACRFAPWRTMCFEQALAAKIMLRRRHIQNTIYFGVRRAAEAKELKAHAWLDSCNITVTGSKNKEAFTVIASFTS